MKGLKVKKKKVQKEKPFVKKERHNPILTVLGGIIALAMVLGFIVYSCSKDESKFKVGDCAINRKFQLVEIESVYQYAKEYHVKRVKSEEFINRTGGWVLITDDSHEWYVSKMDFTDATYTKIPCRSIEWD